MYCGTCNKEIDHFLDDDGMDYVIPCSKCIKTTYAEGVRNGFQLAGEDIADLHPMYKEKE